MKVCVIGNGGREHAIAWRLSISPSVEKVYAVPGSAAMSNCAELVGIDWSQTEQPQYSIHHLLTRLQHSIEVTHVLYLINV